MKPSTELSIEGRAKVRYLIRDVDEQYVVEFDNEPGENHDASSAAERTRAERSSGQCGEWPFAESRTAAGASRICGLQSID
jgi:hypothetical protein